MKKLCIILIVIISGKINAQLPPAAQALYNEFYNTNTVVAQSVLSNSAQAVATADGKTFYLKWFPANSTPSLTPLMVMLHGTGSNVFTAMSKVLSTAMTRSVGVIALQWYLGATSVSPHDYFGDTTLYTYIDTALKRIKYPSNKALFLGFSRGSARSYAIQFQDVYPPNGKNYFCTIMSNAGKPDSLYPFYTSINAGSNHSFCKGKKWAMYCGGLDPNPGRDGCPAMNSAKANWVAANGGTVGLFIQDPNLGHSGFMDTPLYIDSLIKFYLPCHASGTNSIKEYNSDKTFKIFPNPVSNYLSVVVNQNLGEVLNIYDCIGVLKKQIKIENHETKVDVNEFQKGIYFVELGKSRTKFIKE